MLKQTCLALWTLSVSATAVLASETAGVPGSDIRFDTSIKKTIADKPVSLVLTGTALRERFTLNVYAVGSYLVEGVSVRNAEVLAASDSAKVLHLVMERDVSPRDMSSAVHKSITANYSESDFPVELKKFVRFLNDNPVKRGDHAMITHLPGKGVTFEIVGKNSITIENLKFSRAIWDIYLGPRNLGPEIKTGLVSRL